MEDKQMKLLTEVLPRVAIQLRASLGNIYSAMNGIVSAEDRQRDKKLDRNAAILTQSCYRVLRVVNNLDCAPLLAEDSLFALRNVELVEWLGDLCRQAQPLAELAGVTLGFETPLRAHVVGIHREYLERLVWNLLSNALKFTPTGGQITVTLKCVGEQVLLTVADTGCGIPEERQAEVFERYLAEDYTDPLPHGLGLGLPLCRRIAQGHGGRLLLHSRQGEGTVVTAALPNRRTASNVVEDLPFCYDGGLRPVLLELSDALSYEAYMRQYMD